MNALQKITRTIFVLMLCLTFAGAVSQQSASAAGDNYDQECDPNSSEYVGAEDAEEWCNDDEGDGSSEDLSDDPELGPEDETETTTAPAAEATPATTQECANMKECDIPETGPGEVIVSILGVMILGYGARKWVASRHAKHVAMQDLYKNEDNV